MRTQPYASRWVPILTPALTSSDLEPNFKLMASPAERTAVALSQTLQGHYARLLGSTGVAAGPHSTGGVLGAVLAQNRTWLAMPGPGTFAPCTSSEPFRFGQNQGCRG